MAHLVKAPEAVLERLRNEYSKVVAKHPGTDGKSKCEIMKEVLTLDTLHDMDYVTWVVMEGLRWQAPNVSTSWLFMTQDTKVGQVTFKKGDIFNVDMNAIHFDASQWQRPYEFIPERFDNTDPISLKPNG